MLDRASPYFNEHTFTFPTVIEIKYSIPREEEIEVKTPGDLIKKKRLELKLTQKELAQNLKVDEETVYLWEAKNKKPNSENLKKLMNYLGIAQTEVKLLLITDTKT
jgi:DNA-binding transcriptional regulator YiaG